MGCAFCVLVLWCVRCVVVLCVLLVVWCGAAWHAENLSVCRFKTPSCVRSRRLRVYRENAACVEHAGVFRVHTEAS